MLENKNDHKGDPIEQKTVATDLDQAETKQGESEKSSPELDRARSSFLRKIGIGAIPIAVFAGSSLSFKTPESKASPPLAPACQDSFNPENGDITLSSPDHHEGCRYLSMVVNQGSFFLARDSVVTIKAGGREVTVTKGKMLFSPPLRGNVAVVMDPIRISAKGWMELRKEAENIVVISNHEGLKIKSPQETFILNQGEMAVYDKEGVLIYSDRGRKGGSAGLSCSSFESFSGGADGWVKLLLVLSLLIAGRTLSRRE